MRHVSHAFVLSMAAPTASAMGGFTVYSESAGAAAWFSTVQSWGAITFQGFAPGTEIREQYAPLGVHFTDIDWNQVDSYDTDLYPQDGWGLSGGAVVELTLDNPWYSFAAHFPGQAKFAFYSGSTLLFQSALMGLSLDPTHFAGFTSTRPFDRIVLTGDLLPPNFPPDFIFFDNFYFSTVPAPGWFALAAIGGLVRRARGRG